MQVQVNAMQSQLDEMKLEQRPWLSVTDIKLTKDLFIESDNISIVIHITVTNSGKSPAFTSLINVGLDFFKPRFYPRPGITGEDEALKEYCRVFENKTGGFAGNIVVPAAPWIVERTFNKRLMDVRMAQAQMSQLGIYTWPFIVGCVGYRTGVNDPKIHRTPFSYQLLYRDPTDPTRGYGFDTPARIDHFIFIEDAPRSVSPD
jgi:hypothetical protein